MSNNIALLRKLGIYIEEGFLSIEFCANLCSQIDKGTKTISGLHNSEQNADFIDLKKRKTLYSTLSEDSCRKVADKIRALKPTLEAHFSETYSNRFELPRFMLYQTNDYFSPHNDDQLHRKINMTIYLNNESEQLQAGEYVGGKLTLYGLIDHPKWQKKGFSLRGQTGLFIAYPSRIFHAVTPITAGQRYAIVNFLFGN